jgi:ribosomal protein L32E
MHSASSADREKKMASVGRCHPARTREYRTSGLMTFLVNHHGDIYEKDLGWRTAAIASGMTSFDPDDTWRRVTQAVQSASGRR